MKNFLPLTLFLCSTFAGFSQLKYLYCGELLDGVDYSVKKKQTIVVDGGLIVDIFDGYEDAPAEAEIIDLKNQTVLPGLMDMHVHIEHETNPNRYLERFTMNDADIAFQAAVFAERTLMAGFTTVRDLGGSGVNVSLQNAINKGLVKGPRIFTCAKSIAITGGHADPTNGAKKDLFDSPGPAEGVADGPDACRQAVRQQVKNGADLIKITATGGVLSVARDGQRPAFTLEEITAIVETAEDFGIHVAAHAHGDEGMRRAVMAGVQSIEHGTLMSETTMDLMIERGTWYVPTITAGKSVRDSALIPNYYPAVVVPKALEIGPKIQETFAKAYKKGVKIAFGTDAGVFQHGKNALEFVYMTEAGMTPEDALRAATINAATLLNMEYDLGSIEVGKMADIIAVRDNPLKNIATLLDVNFVMKKGVVYKKKN